MHPSNFDRTIGVQGIVQYYAQQTPEKEALIFQEEVLNYRELDQRTSHLAWYLQQQGVGKGDFVALYLKRSLDLLVGILAIQKAGAAYVPMDFDYPKERVALMMEDAQAKVILTHSAYQENLPICDSLILPLDQKWEEINTVAQGKQYQEQTDRRDLAYMIYTSGSTGKPKGVMITHDNIFNQLEGQHNIAPTPIYKMLLTCSISFDVSVLTIYWAWYHGATLVIPEQAEEKDISKLSETIQRHNISHILTLPSLHTMILGQADPAKLQSLKLINVSGEVCPTSLVQKHEQLLPNCQLYNLYGPTEATVNCTYFTFPKGFQEKKAPIGKPIDNYELFILNERLEEVEGGEVGEIYIGGSKPVVGVGYWNRPQLSAERFINNPLRSVRGGEKLYKTGDLGRWMPDGNIEFLGRSDYQVKYRGFRVELGEIEVAIGRYPIVKEVVVLLKNKEEIGNQKLVAYLTVDKESVDGGRWTVDGEAAFNVSEIRAFLAKGLPEYMLPTNYVVLEKMPLTPNGKFDRKALPDPPKTRPTLSQSYQAPKTSLEKRIAVLWEQLLAIEPIGIDDKFFELGGTSIQAAQFIGQLQKELGVSIFVTTIFDYPTVKTYAAFLEKKYGQEIIKQKEQTPTKEPLAVEEKATTVNLPKSQLTEWQINSFSHYIPQLSQVDVSSKKNPSAIFILAPPRSGTSLLRLMLAGHPDLFAVNELKLLGFHNLKERSAAFTGKFALWQEGVVRAIMALKNCDAEAAKLYVHDFEKKNYTTKQLYQQLQAWAHPKRIVDKTPSYALDPLALQKAEKDFANAIYIHLSRHPLSMVHSFEKYGMDQVVYTEKHEYKAADLAELIWYHSHKNVASFLKDIPTNRKFELRYEDLVQAPEETIRQLCQQVNIAFHPSLLQPYEAMDQKLVDGIYKDSRSMSDSNLLTFKKINADKANEWKELQNERNLAESTWSLAEELGYENPVGITKDTSKATSIQRTKPNAINTEGYAIIGMSCRLPGANSLEEFWENLVTGKDVGKEVTPADLEKAGVDAAILSDPNYVARTYALEDGDCFDASFFGIHPKEAQQMDPQHRVLLEAAYGCLENAGYTPNAYQGKIGVMGGVARNSYFSNNIATHADLLASAGEYQDTIGSEKSFSITRIAYKLNLKGPAINVQTACSSSGTAIHLACQTLENGDADIMLIGGGRIQPPLGVGYLYKEGGPLSPDGYIKAFDADAQGMVRGHGMVCIAIKKLDKAIKDKDHIWAVIKSTGVNNDGANKIGFTAPSVQGQAGAIQKALERAGWQAADIDYIEAHGTGTILGDPIELEGLTQAFQHSTEQTQFCGLGSVKTAIGHLDAGACIAGIIKMALALHKEAIPPSLNYTTPNPQIPFKQSPFYVVDTLKKWERGQRIRRAGVSSFGLGGTNVHVLLEEAPIEESGDRRQESGGACLITLSAKTKEQLAQQEELIQPFIAAEEARNLTNVAYTLATGRANLPYKKAILLDPISNKRKAIAQKNSTAFEKVVWMFPGGGAQYVGMAKDLYQTYPVFKTEVDNCLFFLNVEEGLDVSDLLLPQDATKDLSSILRKPTYALAALFTIEYALAKLWQHWGLQADEFIGHSMGEYVAACLAGVFSLEDGLRLVTLRGRLFDSLSTKGGMLSVALSEKDVTSFLVPNSSISVINKPDNCVVSGTEEAISTIAKQLEKQGIDCSRIHIQVAAHSAQIDPIIPAFKEFLEQIDFQLPTIPIISNLSGTYVEPKEIASVDYWVNHLRQTVRFSDGLGTLLKEDKVLFVEVGPGQTLSTFAKQHPLKNKSHTILPSIRHPKEPTNDVWFLLKTLGAIWVEGQAINWDNYYRPFDTQKIPLPTYPFKRDRFWIEPKKDLGTSINEGSQTAVSQNQISIPTHQEAIVASAIAQTVAPTPNKNNMTRKTVLVQEIKNILYDLSGLDPAEMELDATFLELGFDSLFLSQAVIQFNNKFEVDISFRSLFETTPTIGSLADFLDETIDPHLFQPAPAIPSVPTTNLAPTNGQPILALPPSMSNGANTPVPSALADLVQQQLNIMQQQLHLLQNNNLVKKEAVGIRNNGTNSTTTSKKVLPTNGVDREVTIKRSTKGVTAKMASKKVGKLEDLTDKQRIALADFINRYTTKTQKSKAQASLHKTYYSDPRSVTGFSTLWKEMVYQISAERSKGAKFWDIDGNEYIDYVMSYGVALFGHMPDFIEQAVVAQMQKGNGLDLLTPEATEIARMVCEVSGMDRASLASTGTEAVLGAVRAARTYSGKDRIAVFDTDYHGWVGQFMLRGVHFKNSSKALPSAPGIPKKIVEDTLVLDYDDPNVLEKLKANIKDLAAVVIEPVQAQNPHWQHHELIKALRVITAEHDVALIFDEIINGFRLAQNGAQAWFGVEADIVAYGKSISGGLPMSAIAGKEKYMQAFDGGIWQFGDDSRPEASITYFASTFIKNPISVAAGYAAMKELIRQGPALQEGLNRTTQEFAANIKEIFLRLKAPYMIQATASIYMIKTLDANPLTRLLFPYLRMRGVYMRERPCFISTAHTQADFEKTYKAITAAIEELFASNLIQPYEGEDLNVIYVNEPQKEVIASNPKEPFSIPLSDGQEEIWLSHQFSKDAAAAYNIVTQIVLNGQLDKEKLKIAIGQVVQRHESLRTTFAMDGKSQTIQPTQAASIEELSWTALTDIEQRVSLEEVHQTESTTPFDLEYGPLARFLMIERAANEHLLLINVHHIICDGWSLGIITREIGELYAQLVGASYQPLAKAKGLSTYVKEQLAHQQTKKFKKDEAFWLKQFEDSVPVLEMPTDYPRSAVKSYPGRQEKIPFTADFYQSLQKAAAKEGTTPYIFIMAAFKAFLMRLSNQEEVVFGMAAAGHNLPGNDTVVGHLINLLPIRSSLANTTSFRDFLKEVRGKVLDGFDHQNYTFGRLLKKLTIERNANRNTLVSVAFNMDSPLGEMNFGGLEVMTQMVPKRFEVFDAFINLKPVDDRLDFEWTYNADLFRRDTIQLRLSAFHHFLEQLVSDPDKGIKNIDLVATADQEVLQTFQQGPTAVFPVQESLHSLFEKQVQLQPNKTAIIIGKNRIAYQAFNERANRIAHFLRKEGLQNGQYVAICMNSSIELMTCIYGILKAGGVYVPIDPRNPKDRIQLILSDAKCQILISALGVGEFSNFRGKHFILDHLEGRLQEENRHDLKNVVVGTQEAYVIYTSGSTGKPKGVAIQHRHAINTLFAINEHLQLTAEDTVYSVSSMSFDMSIPDYFLSLIKGATLILAEENTKKDGFALQADLDRYKPTFMQATPTTWKILLLSGWEGNDQMTIVAGGEGFPKEVATQLLKKTKAVWNGYGPTETTIYATYKEVTSDYLEQKPYGEFIPIGKPIANVWTLILDDKKQQVPVGIPGELYIGGAGVTTGYINRSELTAEKFLSQEFANIPVSEWYKTGDLVRYLPNGDIDFLGRIDTQVKIRGFRIELGEIEAQLNQHPAIQQSVISIVAEEGERKELVAYYITKEKELTEDTLKSYLKDRLPGYMVPALYMKMESFPQNTSLKIDRKALPKPTRTKLAKSLQYEPPRTVIEKKLSEFWQEVLKVDQISIHDDFFDLGGHSLVAVELLAAIYKETAIKLPITSLFQNATIHKQAKLLSQTSNLSEKNWTSLVPIKQTGKKPPLYLIHGGGLHVLFYQSLVRHMDEDQPIFALQAKGLDGTSEPLDTIEAMATHYINEILDQNPNGPFHLAGYSLGGLIAYEMAKQLKEMGKEIGMVALFDAVAKDEWTDQNKFDKFLKKTSYNFSILLKKPIETISYKSNILKQKYQHILGKVKVAYQDTASQELSEGLLPYGKIVYEKSIEAFWKYKLNPSDISILLFKAKDQMFYLKDPAYNGWREYALGGVQVYEVAGNHHNMFDEDTDLIASILQKYIDQIGTLDTAVTGKG